MLLCVIWLCWGVTVVCAAVDWVAVAQEKRNVEIWAKPATLAALFATALVLGAPDTTAGVLLLVALAFGLLGDVMLLGSSTARFQAGLAAFLVGHLAYVVSFLFLRFDEPLWAFIGVAVVAVALVTSREVLPSVHRTDGAALTVPVAIYMIVISVMAVVAWATGTWLLGLGATVFLASDTILAVDRFVKPRPWGRVAVMVTYHVGQVLIVIGFFQTSPYAVTAGA